MKQFKDLNQKLLQNPEAFIKNLLPNGKRQFNEYITLNPKRSDRSPGSFKINLKTGKWADFATGDRGSDLISLYAYIKNCSQTKALKEIGGNK